MITAILSKKNKKKRFDFTKNRAYKHWELERCLNEKKSPIDNETSSNLKFLIGLRHEIEHQMASKIDDILSARFQGCCINFNRYLKSLFPTQKRIENYLSFSLQFSSLNKKQIDQLKNYSDLPHNISMYIQNFDVSLDDTIFNDSRFAYRVLFVPKTANRKGQADKVIEFVPSDSEIAKGLSKEYWATKDREKPKYLPTKIIEEIQKLGYIKFQMHQHTQLWKNEDMKNPAKGYGVQIEKTWHWYENWFEFVKNYCQKNILLYS